MAMQVIVEVVEIVKREKGGTLTLRLKLFAGGADPEVDDPLFEDIASAPIKAHVAGKTRQQLVDDATIECCDKLIDLAEIHERVQEYISMVNVATAEQYIATKLAG
jgi:hypothetical protein